MRWLRKHGLLLLPDGADPEKADFGIESVTKNVKLAGESTRCVVFRNPRNQLKKLLG